VPLVHVVRVLAKHDGREQQRPPVHEQLEPRFQTRPPTS
jgi:hypothetical protein